MTEQGLALAYETLLTLVPYVDRMTGHLEATAQQLRLGEPDGYRDLALAAEGLQWILEAHAGIRAVAALAYPGLGQSEANRDGTARVQGAIEVLNSLLEDRDTLGAADAIENHVWPAMQEIRRDLKILSPILESLQPATEPTLPKAREDDGQY